ncbi:SdrD B-like domain-containing protein, partial [Clostridium perfringens]
PYTPEVATGKNITAIKIHANTLTSTDGAKEVTVKLAPANNKGGDIYTNNFSGRVSNVNAIVYSNDVPITVVSSSIGDYVWNDANGNGVKDSGELGIPNVTVNLLDQQGNKIASTVTNSEGYYSFNELHSGSYQVKVDESTLPNNLIQTYDLDKVLDNSTIIQLDANTQNHDVNFGYKEKLGNLVVKYLEQGTNKELAPEVTGKEKVGTDYTTIAEAIDGYTLVSTP